MAAWQNRSDIVELLIVNGGKVNPYMVVPANSLLIITIMSHFIINWYVLLYPVVHMKECDGFGHNV